MTQKPPDERDENRRAGDEDFLADAEILSPQRRWLLDNKSAFAAYNERIEEHGLFSDGQRSF